MSPMKYVELKRIKELLICGICYDFMDTSVMTLCSHNYCSLCIRKYLLYKTQCPTCFTETFEKDLRTNKILDEIIIQYLNIEEKFKKESYHKEIEITKDNDSEDTCLLDNLKYEKETDIPNTSEISHKVFDSSISTVTISTPCVQKVYRQDVSSPSTSTSPKIPLIFTPKSKKGFRNQDNCKIVNCPVCKVDMPENNINKHLDDCLKRENTKDQPKRIELKRKPLAKLVLSLMKDSGMRKKLKELGLSSQGDRKMLENRLQRYIILYNAECDKINPRPVSELIKQCEEEEHLEKKIQKPSNRLNVNRNTERNVIEQQRKIYLTENKNSFDQLITKIKTADNSRKLSVRRDILSKGHFDTAREGCTKNQLTVKDSKTDDLLSMHSYIDDSDSNTPCPLQIYSSENPMNFLRVELSCSSDDNSNQCAATSKQNTLDVPCNVSLTSVSSIVKTENKKTKLLSSKNTSIHEEVVSTWNNATNAFHVEESDVSENRMDLDAKESCSKLTKIGSKNRKGTNLLVRRNDDSIRQKQEKYDTHFDSIDKWEKLCDNVKDPFVKDIKYDKIVIDDADDRFDEESKQQLYNASECVPDRIKFEKENMESMDESIIALASNRSRDNINAFRKRERDMSSVLSDDEKIADRSTPVTKSARFGLSETIGFNNENLDDITSQFKEESQKEKVQLRAACVKNVNSPVKRSTRLRSKINSNRKK